MSQCLAAKPRERSTHNLLDGQIGRHCYVLCDHVAAARGSFGNVGPIRTASFRILTVDRGGDPYDRFSKLVHCSSCGVRKARLVAFDVTAVWRERASNVSGRGLPGGHNLQYDLPTETLAELRAFLRS